ncbi:MAG: hypothetical protein MMC33_009474 [Icmadophila ericetorum]|nr:hypothetical protein [Icmadophila ericetorum]
MSTTTHSQSTLPPAPWKSLFLTHLSKLPSPEFVLATVQPSPLEDAPVPYIPRLRYCIFRGMWTELPPNNRNSAPQNSHVYESELPTFTTDVRMEKVPQIFASSAGHGDVSQSQGSGGGGPVEAVWWIKEVGTQWRVRGEAFVIDRDIEGGGEEQESSGVRTVKSEIGKRMRLVKPESEAEWSWGTELTAHFGNVSPGMRGSWKNPPPGTPVKGNEPDKNHVLGQKVNDLEDPIARSNFRVVVIKPESVEQLDLSDPEKARRWRYDFIEGEGGKGEWTVTELWP